MAVRCRDKGTRAAVAWEVIRPRLRAEDAANTVVNVVPMIERSGFVL